LCDGFKNKGAFADCFNAEYYDEYLQSCGFEIESEWLAYRIDIMERFDREKYRRAAEWLCARFGYTVDIQIAGRKREYCEAVSRVMDIGQRQYMERVMDILMPFLEKTLCPVVFVGDEPVGFLLTIRKKSKEKHPQTPRIVTLWVHEKWRRKGVTALLFDCAARQAEAMGLTVIDASLIQKEKTASRLGAENAGGRVTHRYRQYEIDF
jgi:GNAT superfamily N-acetyltransferase